ncbi:MAG: alkaline phosphatase, partial [Proteobacteria bacterium]|nr:alkaline phosphatase [Pseudomonadota bacterium]
MAHIFFSASLVFFFSCFIASAAPKNVILLIGDGMGEAEVSLTRNYEFDAGPGLFIDTIKNKASAIVISKRNHDQNIIAFVGDSASGGTALATGELTSVRRISTTAQFGVPIKTIAEIAKENNFKVGIVTTAVITDATPASFGAHVTNRYCMKPGDSPCQGDTSIIEQMIDLNIDVMLGGGERLLPAMNGNKTVEQMALEHGYKILKNPDQLSGMPTNKNEKLWGIFADYHLPREWQGNEGRIAEKIPVDENNKVIFPKASRCELNPAHADSPTLEAMTERALQELDSKTGKRDKGFFLMVEGASIDKSAHDADPCAMIGEMLAFDRTIKMVVEYAKNHKDTIVIVTADHGGATQNIHHPYYEKYKRNGNHIPGLYKLLVSNGGNELVAYYATNNE